MPRPVKCRKVCHFPNVLEFLPADDTEKKTPIVLTVDEYETIRLLDKKGYSQEQCAASMQVARTTVQRIYEIARKKIADALIDGYPLKIEGGDFKICDGQSSNCGLGGCYKQELHQKYAAEKGEGIMRIAVTYENGQILLRIVRLTSSSRRSFVIVLGAISAFLRKSDLLISLSTNNFHNRLYDTAIIVSPILFPISVTQPTYPTSR